MLAQLLGHLLDDRREVVRREGADHRLPDWECLGLDDGDAFEDLRQAHVHQAVVLRLKALVLLDSLDELVHILGDFVDLQLRLLFDNRDPLVEKLDQFLREPFHVVKVMHIDRQLDLLCMLSIDGIDRQHEGVSEVLQVSREVFSLLVDEHFLVFNFLLESGDFVLESLHALVDAQALNFQEVRVGGHQPGWYTTARQVELRWPAQRRRGVRIDVSLLHLIATAILRDLAHCGQRRVRRLVSLIGSLRCTGILQDLVHGTNDLLGKVIELNFFSRLLDGGIAGGRAEVQVFDLLVPIFRRVVDLVHVLGLFPAFLRVFHLVGVWLENVLEVVEFAD